MQRGRVPVRKRPSALPAATQWQVLTRALTAFALPIWLLIRTGWFADLGRLWALALICGVFVLPVAEAIIHRVDRRRIMIVASGTSLPACCGLGRCTDGKSICW